MSNEVVANSGSGAGAGGGPETRVPVLYVIRFQLALALLFTQVPLLMGGRFNSLFLVDPFGYATLTILALWAALALAAATAAAMSTAGLLSRARATMRYGYGLAPVLSAPILFRVLADSTSWDAQVVSRYIAAALVGGAIALGVPITLGVFTRLLQDRLRPQSSRQEMGRFGWAFLRLLSTAVANSNVARFRLAAIVFFAGYCVGSAALRPPVPLWFPSLGFLLITFTATVFVVCGLAMIADRWHVPVTLLVTVGIVLTVWFGGDAHRHVVTPNPTSLQMATPEESAQGEGQTRIVLAASGGGSRAAAWSATVVRELQTSCREFLPSVEFVSAVSGGSLGWLYVADVIEADGTASVQSLERAVQRSRMSALKDVGWAMAYPHVVRRLLLQTVGPFDDRAWALEEAWRRDWNWNNRRLSDWRRRLAARQMPATALNAALTERGLPLLLANFAVPDYWLDYGFADADNSVDIDLVTAVRLSATFPLVTPESDAFGPTTITSRVTDGGYFDNTGLYTALLWVADTLLDLDEDSRVLMIEIYSTSDEVEPGFDERKYRQSGRRRSLGWLEPLRAVLNVKPEHERLLTQTLVGAFRQTARKEGMDVVSFRFPLYGVDASWELTRRDLEIIDKRTRDAVFRGKAACICSALKGNASNPDVCEKEFSESISMP